MTMSIPTPHILQCLQKGSGYLPRAMWSSVLISCLWDAGFELTAKHLTSHWGWGRGVLWIKLPTQRGKERSCGHQPRGSWSKQPGISTSMWVSYQNCKATSTAAPRKLFPGGRSLSRLCYDFSKPTASHFTLSKQGEGFGPMLMNNATLIKHSWVH